MLEIVQKKSGARGRKCCKIFVHVGRKCEQKGKHVQKKKMRKKNVKKVQK